MPESSRMLAYMITLSALANGLIKPVHSTETRAAFWDNAAGRQPYKKREMPSLSALLTPPDRSTVTVDEIAALIAEAPILAKSMVQRFLDNDGDGLLSDTELMELWK